MKIKTKIAQMVTHASILMAKKACGSASLCGIYQPKEPDIPQALKKK